MTAVGFEPTQLALVELESTPLDHSGKVSWQHGLDKVISCCVKGLHMFLGVFAQTFARIMYRRHMHKNGPTRA